MRVFTACVIALLLVGCTLGFSATPPPLHTTLTTASPTPSPTPRPDEWESLAPGLEQRQYLPNNNIFSEILVLRIDPAYYGFRAHYVPGSAYRVNEWQNLLPGAVAFVNANYFHTDLTISGLLVADGVVYGRSFNGYGGMLQVENGIPRIRSNVLEPYWGEFLEQAVQAFPMVVLNGMQAYTNTRPDRATRRTIVGQDTSGRILLMATPKIGLTLLELSAYLPTTDLNLLHAVNLDGGGSTMMAVSVGDDPHLIASFDPVPAVLAVYPK